MVSSVFDRGNQPMLTDRSTGKGYYIPRTLPGPGPNMRPPRMNYPTGGFYGTRNDYPPVSRTAAAQNTSPVQRQSAAGGYGDAGGYCATNAAASRDAYNSLGGGVVASHREGYGSRGYSAAALGDPMSFAGASRRAVLQNLYGQEPRAGYGDQQQQQQSQHGGRQQTGYATGATQYGGRSGQQYGSGNGGVYGSEHGAGYGGGYGERSGGEYGGGGSRYGYRGGGGGGGSSYGGGGQDQDWLYRYGDI